VRVSHCGLISSEQPIGGMIQPIADGLVSNGVEVTVFARDSSWDFDKCDIIISYGPMQSIVEIVLRLGTMDHVPPMVMWYTEPPPSPNIPRILVHALARVRYSVEAAFHSYRAVHQLLNHKPLSPVVTRLGRFRALGELLALHQSGFLKLVCVFTYTSLDLLRSYALPVTEIPMGYHPTFGRRLDIARDIDVVFLGSTRDRRRQRLVSNLEVSLSKMGVSFVIKDGSPTRGYVFGEERTVLLNRAKILINIMRQPWDDPVFRLLLAAPNGATFLSEEVRSSSTGPFRPGEHLITVCVDDLAEAIAYYINRPREREEIAWNAYDFVTSQLTMERVTRKLLQKLETGGQ
jgi:hypothetical protein